MRTWRRPAKLISDTERRSMAAERDTMDRYLAAYLSDRVGAEFAGPDFGRAAVWVVREAGRDRGRWAGARSASVGREYFHYDADSQTLMGADTGLTIGIGQRVTVRLAEAVPVTGGLMLELLEIDGGAMPSGRGARRGPPPRRGAGKAAAKRRVVRQAEMKRLAAVPDAAGGACGGADDG